MDSIRSTCPYCGVGCGVTIHQDKTSSEITITGDKEHPANLGRLCVKGAALAETLHPMGRLLAPEIQGKRSSWEQALDYISAHLQAIINRYGRESVAFYASGQLLTEDYYVVNKFAKGFIGTPHIDTNSRLCMSSSVAGHVRAFGEDGVANCYEDLELADCVILVGSNLAWCHPVLYQRLSAAKQQRPDMKVVVIDPRRTASCDIADIHLQIRADSDVYLFNGLLQYLVEQNQINEHYISLHTEGFNDTFKHVKQQALTVSQVALHCGIAEIEVREFYQLFSDTEKTLSLFSQGVNQSASGTDKVNSIINCHLATGRIAKEGAGAFSITGQPNAMGGREVGGLANQLAAHRAYTSEDIEEVASFWQAPNMVKQAGLKAVDMFAAMQTGKIKAVWILGTNPVVSLPDSEQVKRALKQCELVVVADCMQDTDTSAYAHVKLPALPWGEKDGTVTNSERRISRQRAFLPAIGEAKADWWMISEVAKRLGFTSLFNYQRAADIFREHAQLSLYENQGKRCFDLTELAELSADQYDSLSPTQWGGKRLFDQGKFSTTTGKAQFISTVLPTLPAESLRATYPFILNTGRIRDQWHTMTRTGYVARLSRHIEEPFIHLHPDDAASQHIDDGQLVRVHSAQGEAIVKAVYHRAQTRGTVFIPMHWNTQFSHKAGVNSLVAPIVDPHSGQPALKYTAVHIEALKPIWQGTLLTREPINCHDLLYWTKIKTTYGWRYVIAGDSSVEAWSHWAQFAEAISYKDPSLHDYRGALFAETQLQQCLFINTQTCPDDVTAEALFEAQYTTFSQRLGLLIGTSIDPNKAVDKTICSCFGVGKAKIVEAIQQNNLSSVVEIGELLKAGTNCGSCIPELKQILVEAKAMAES